MASEQDYYELLGVARDADDSTIKKAFRRLARQLHPDVSQEPDAESRFREVTEESFRECLVAGIRNQREAYATGEPARMMEAFLAKRAARKSA